MRMEKKPSEEEGGGDGFPFDLEDRILKQAAVDPNSDGSDYYSSVPLLNSWEVALEIAKEVPDAVTIEMAELEYEVMARLIICIH